MPGHQVSPARVVAYDAFSGVLDDRKPPEVELERLYAEHGLSRPDRNLAKEIVYGGLRWYSKIFWILQNTASRDLEKVKPCIRTALVLGTYQIFYLDRVPDRAAVNESVEYVRRRGEAAACSFVNGILRQIARRAEYFAKPDKVAEPVKYYSLQFAHPPWIVERWLSSFRVERVESMLVANNQPPPVTVRANALKTPVQEVHLLQQELLRQERTHSERLALRGALRLKEFPNLEDGSLFAQGYYTLQDQAAQLIGHLVAGGPDELIVEACAGPGGKISHLAELTQNAAQLIAVERDATQLQRGQATTERLSAQVNWVAADFLEWQPERPPQRVLLDAPCSGLGVLRRHPEGKWHKTPQGVQACSEAQWGLLQHAVQMLAPGGELVYSVCSFEPEESVQHLKRCQAEMGNSLEIVSPVARLPDYFKRYVTRDNILMIYSGNQDGMDGFAAFILRKAL